MGVYGTNLYELLYMYRQGEETSFRMLVNQIRPLLRKMLTDMICRYPPLEMYREDLLQEAYIVLSYALDTFHENDGSKLQTYIMLILGRRIVQQAKRCCESRSVRLHMVMSIDKESPGERQIAEVIEDHKCWYNPEFMLAYNCALERLDSTVQEMNASDFYIANAWACGTPYKEGSRVLNVSYKAYDGRMQKVKKRIHEEVCR